MKRFNVTGKCIPAKHYMVDITSRIDKIKKMINDEKYFYISRGRQYGKTTTLSLLRNSLSNDFSVFFMSFEGMSDKDFATLESLCYEVMTMLADQVEIGIIENLSKENADIILSVRNKRLGELSAREFSKAMSLICRTNSKPVVLIIDEVDQAGNHDSFIKFLGVLRNMYLNRDMIPAFQSVILAGVYDIKNLKLKIRNEGEHQYNSPWNIASNFDMSMEFSVSDIVTLLEDYEIEHTDVYMDKMSMAQYIFDYTGGYPYLVSRLCQQIDENCLAWNRHGLLEAVKVILAEENTLFDDMQKKFADYPELKEMFRKILYQGQHFSYVIDDYIVKLASMFGYIRNSDGDIKIANRIFETRLYNLFAFEASRNEKIYMEGAKDKKQFIENNALNMKQILIKFVEHFNDIYTNKDAQFIENMGRKMFLLYLKPIINGTGNYYIEAETRDETRTDIIVDYLGKQYIIELKIWHGDKYREKGEQQLIKYLDRYHQTEGYLVSFCFNKNKQSGVNEVYLDGKLLIEAMV